MNVHIAKIKELNENSSDFRLFKNDFNVWSLNPGKLGLEYLIQYRDMLNEIIEEKEEN